MKTKLFVSLLFCVFLSMNVSAQNEKFKALFLYNFTKFIEWPESHRGGDFVIGVMGSSPIIGELTTIADKKTVGTQNMIVKKINSATEANDCHIVYVPANQSSKIDAIISTVGSTPVLVISDKDGLISSGSGINYVSVNGKQKFEVSKSNIESTGLKVNSQLLSLGISK